MSKKLIYSILLIAVFAGSTHAQFISGVAHRNTDTDAPEPPEIAPNPLDEDELTFVDRTHQYNDIPANLIGAQYVMTANDNKNISGYELDVTMAANATLYIFVDNRMGGSGGGMGVDPDITGMPWLTDMGFEDTGDDIGIDESGDGDIDQYSSVFSKYVLAGTTVTLRGDTEGHGGNMYGVAALGPKLKAYNPVPVDVAIYEDTWVSLGWSPGDTAVSHDVYFGDNFDDVNAGAESTFQGNQAGTNLIVGFLGFPYPDGLVPGTTYYWRIDEVNDTDPNSPWKGDVWSFWIPPKKAYEPNPPDGAKFVVLDVTLSWTAGFGAKLHHVYFGDNFDDVNEGVVGLPQATTSYTPGTLVKDAVYYWRVDEFDGAATYKGDVWSFKTVPDIPITDPNLFCWWKFDVGSGTTAPDWSGHDNHGTIQGDPQWVAGQVGGALDFGGEGDRVVDEDAENYLNGLDALTVCIWIKSDVAPTDKGFIICEEPDGGDNIITMRYDAAGATGGGTSVLKMAVVAPDDEQQLESSSNLQVTEWQHVCMVWSRGEQLKFYVNGVLDTPQANGDPRDVSTSNVTTLIVGQGGKDAGGGWDGLIDDVRIYNKVLTAEDIKEVMRGEPDLAWNPNPANGSTPYIREATPFSWSPGDFASQHDVYFGIDRDAVADANASDTTGIYRGRQGITFYTPPEGVEWGGGPYYWRIDEYNTDATISKGRIWSFTVADYIVIDDFEDYNDYPPDEIFSTWIDGWEVPTNGSLAGHPDPPFAETGNVHGGSQSMPVYYENNFKYSEITMTLVWPRDWTEEGVGVLSLWFYGDAANAAERMYVALNGIAVVYHANPDAAQIATWTEWPIDLQEFATQGVNLANVNTVSIGFGDKNNLQAGGSGVVFFDDIRLYRPAPEPEPAP